MSPRAADPPHGAGRDAGRDTGADASQVVAIAELLRELGFDTVHGRRTARRVLERAGLTNPRKQNIATGKRLAVGEALDTALAAHCGADGCREIATRDPRDAVRVAPQACEVCGGRGTDQALRTMVRSLKQAGRSRLVIVGGSPNSRQQLTDVLSDTTIKFRMVDGERAPQPRRAQQWAEWADLIVIWASTAVGHKVTEHFQRPEHTDHTIVVPRRGLEALAQEVERHLAGGRENRGRGGRARRG